MGDEEIMNIVREFREGILSGGSSEFMCIAICAPLEGYLRFAHGIETHAVAGNRLGRRRLRARTLLA
jgi:hypothetical protein